MIKDNVNNKHICSKCGTPELVLDEDHITCPKCYKEYILNLNNKPLNINHKNNKLLLLLQSNLKCLDYINLAINVLNNSIELINDLIDNQRSK
jgi:hypothetical protein